jgi:hypothetical protein
MDEAQQARAMEAGEAPAEPGAGLPLAAHGAPPACELFPFSQAAPVVYVSVEPASPESAHTGGDKGGGKAAAGKGGIAADEEQGTPSKASRADRLQDEARGAPAALPLHARAAARARAAAACARRGGRRAGPALGL